MPIRRSSRTGTSSASCACAQTAFRDPAAYFHRYATLSPEEAHAKALEIWSTINRINLDENILPTRQRARLILRKSADHRVESVALRKL